MLAQLKGFMSKIAASAKASEVGPSFSRRKIGAISSSVCMMPARTAEGDAPVMNTKKQTSRMPATEESGLAPNSI